MELNIRLLLERAERYFPTNEVVTRMPDGEAHRYSYADLAHRARLLASGLSGLGVNAGDRLATMAWNNYRHFELYFALPCAGTVLHTVNLRLADEHLIHILNHSEDRVVFLDPDMIPTLERISDKLQSVEAFVVMAEDIPECSLENVVSYEKLIADGDPGYKFPELPERSPAAMCYTSATTGLPKGVVYTHRDIYLHTITVCMGDALNIRERDTVLPVVPMFHANAWGLPFAAASVGAKMVFPGSRPQAADIVNLIHDESVTFAAAAVSVGIDMRTELERQHREISSLRALMLGGSTTPPSLMEFYIRNFGVPIVTAWGATELAPLATFTHIHRQDLSKPAIEHIPVRTRQGIPLPGVELKVLDEENREVPWDDKSVGELYVKAAWGATEYYQDQRSDENFVNGYWKSGDMATVNADGALRLVDRSKDLIKSGGEWISSVDLENALVAHPGVYEVAVVAVPHPKWIERPCAYIVQKPGTDPKLSEQELTNWLSSRFAKWWLPDHYLFVDSIPKTGVGKVNKRALRSQVEEDVAATEK